MHTTLHKTAIVTISLSSRGLTLTHRMKTACIVGSHARGIRRHIRRCSNNLKTSIMVRTMNDPTACIVTISRIDFAKHIMYVNCTGDKMRFRAGCFMRGRLSVHNSQGTLPTSFHTMVRCVGAKGYPMRGLVSDVISPRGTSRTVRN